MNLNNNVFSAVCQDTDNQFSQINYDIGFKVPNELMPIVNKIKNKSLKFCTMGKVEWPYLLDLGKVEWSYLPRKIIVTVESIEIK